MVEESSHVFVPDDDGLFCLFCGRTGAEHKSTHSGLFGAKPSAHVIYNEEIDEKANEEDDDFEAIQEELRKLTRECRRERDGRMKAEELLSEMKRAHEKLRDDVGHLSQWGSNSDGQLASDSKGHGGMVEIKGLLRQVWLERVEHARTRARTHTRARAHTHARTRTHAHTHTHTGLGLASDRFLNQSEHTQTRCHPLPPLPRSPAAAHTRALSLTTVKSTHGAVAPKGSLGWVTSVRVRRRRSSSVWASAREAQPSSTSPAATRTRSPCATLATCTRGGRMKSSSSVSVPRMGRRFPALSS